MNQICHSDLNSNESYKHIYAKIVLCNWLKEGNIEPFYWRGDYGIHLELPILKSSNIYYFENSKGLIEPKIEQFCNCFPTMDNLLFIPDITIFHKGAILYFIEIVHKSAVSDKKLQVMYNWIRNNYVELHQISADWILNQVGRPNAIKTSCIRFN